MFQVFKKIYIRHVILVGDATDIRYQVLTNCDLQIIGEEFSRKPYALAVQQGSPLKDQFNDALVLMIKFENEEETVLGYF